MSASTGPATPLDVEACSLCGRPLTWNESDTLKAWVCHNCPGTPSEAVDVEACVRLLEEAKSLLADRARNRRRAAGEAEHSAEGFQWLALANQDDELVAVAGALASALLGMGKDSEAIDALEHGLIELECMGTTARYFNVYVPNAPLLTTAGGAPLRVVLAEALTAARAAQPQETKNG